MDSVADSGAQAGYRLTFNPLPLPVKKISTLELEASNRVGGSKLQLQENSHFTWPRAIGNSRPIDVSDNLDTL